MFAFWAKNLGLLAVIVGLLTAFMTVMLIEALGHSIYPPGEMLDYSKPETIENYIRTAPLGAMIFVVIAQVLAAFVGGYVSTKIAPPTTNTPFLITVVLFTVVVIINYLSMPHPMWMIFATLIGIVIAAYSGYFLARRTTKKMLEEG